MQEKKEENNFFAICGDKTAYGNRDMIKNYILDTNQDKLNYYMSLDYKISVIEIPEDEGGGYCASIPSLGIYTFRGDGETIVESINNLNEVKKVLFKDMIESGIEILEP